MLSQRITSKWNKTVLEVLRNIRPHRLDVTKAWHHFWESQGATTRYSWMGMWRRHNLWSFGWMDAAPLDDWRRHLGDWMRHSMLSTWIWLCLNCLVTSNYLLKGNMFRLDIPHPHESTDTAGIPTKHLQYIATWPLQQQLWLDGLLLPGEAWPNK